ncbi:acetyl-/propionyl-coenzyme A carboxylase alpha chain [Acrasis kona]|uniref:Acetyl-/propionyl-coenzyme A carboxylase alpha chain n=1 Tax=Acrasis kona TaxID=1008807 RepID=A0AAW2Z7S1_9EUKA
MYYDQNKQYLRVDYNRDDKRIEQFWDINKKQYWLIDRIDLTCKVSNLSNVDVPTSFGNVPLVTDNGLLTPGQLFSFGEEYNQTYRGQEQVRGITCNRWDTTFESTSGQIQTLSSYFSVPEWKYPEFNSQSQIPVRSVVKGTFKSSNQTIQSQIIRDYLDFSIIVSDDTLQVPFYCSNNLLTPPPMPTLTDSYQCVMELSDVNAKVTTVVSEYWNYEIGYGRVDYRKNLDDYLIQYIEADHRIMFEYDSSSDSCAIVEIPDQFLDDSKTKLIYFKDELSFGPEFGEVYVGEAVIRGRNVDRFQSVVNRTFAFNAPIQGIGPITIDHYFSKPDKNGKSIPMSAIYRASPSSLYHIDVDIVQYQSGQPDRSLFALPIACGGLGHEKPGTGRDLKIQPNYNDRDGPDFAGYFTEGGAAGISIASAVAGIVVGFVVGCVICHIMFFRNEK